jgi:hypothetical protein
MAGLAPAAALVLLCSRGAAADPEVMDAELLFEQGRALMADGRYAEACPKLEKSQERDPGIGTEFNLARCYELQGRLASALAMYRRVADESRAAGQADRESVARNLGQELASRVPHLVLRVASPDPGTTVELDGTLVPSVRWSAPLELDPGAHELDVAAPERIPWRTVLRVEREGDTISVDVPPLVPKTALQPVPPPPPPEAPASTPRDVVARPGSAQRVVALALGAAGLAGLVPATVFGLKAIALESQATPLCPDGQCSPPGYSDRTSSRTYGDASTVTFVVSGVLLASAGIVWLTAPRGSDGRRSTAPSRSEAPP